MTVQLGLMERKALKATLVTMGRKVFKVYREQKGIRAIKAFKVSRVMPERKEYRVFKAKEG